MRLVKINNFDEEKFTSVIKDKDWNKDMFIKFDCECGKKLRDYLFLQHGRKAYVHICGECTKHYALVYCNDGQAEVTEVKTR